MAARGYPKLAVLTKLSPLGPCWVVTMAYKADGVPTDVRTVGVRRNMAWGLARFIAVAADCRDMPNLPRRQLPVGQSIWPTPHNILLDFDTTRRGAEWIDEIARAALVSMRNAKSRIVVGHHDWSAKNMRMGADGIAVLYDRDAVFVDREAFVLGTAAAHFPVTWKLPVPETPSVDEVRAFVRDYEQARRSNLTASELAETAAGATYARAYKARCERRAECGPLARLLARKLAEPWPFPLHLSRRHRRDGLTAAAAVDNQRTLQPGKSNENTRQPCR